MSEWISVKKKHPPRDRNILICDEFNWVFVGLHERNYLSIEIPAANVDYDEKYKKHMLNSMIYKYQSALDFNRFRCITVDYCDGEALYWMELPRLPIEDPTIWTCVKKREPEFHQETLMFHKKLGIIEGYGIDQSDTYSCKAYWKPEDITHWMELPKPPKDKDS